MNKLLTVIELVVIQTFILSAEPVSLSGTVKDASGSAIEGVEVTLTKIDGVSSLTDAEGSFTLAGTAINKLKRSSVSTKTSLNLLGNKLIISSLPVDAKGRVDIFSSSGKRIMHMQFGENTDGEVSMKIQHLSPGLHLIRLCTGYENINKSLLCFGKSDLQLINEPIQKTGIICAKRLASSVVDTLKAVKSGYTDVKVPIDSYEKENIGIVMQKDGVSGPMPLVYDVENTGKDCDVTTNFPSFNALEKITNFPDPFLMDDGSHISKKSEWVCRRAQISNQIQYWELGTKPPSSASEVTASFSGKKLTVDVKVGSKSVTLSTTISYPSGGTPPYPALITMDGSGVPSDIFSSRGCAVMKFSSGDLTGGNSFSVTRGSGKFWDLFPNDPTAGGYCAWTWGLSRLIDGLYITQEENDIDVKHLAVTGCSYAGKMALWVGAFDERIALTIPEESGGGGEASWRFMATQTGTEDLNEAQGTGWYSSRLKQFNNSNATNLPIDQHELVAMVAPRAILVVSNTGIDRLGSQAGLSSMLAAAEVYKALGIPERIGYTQTSASGHCQFPSSQKEDVAAFVDKFLLGKENANTDIKKTPYNPDMSKWITWETPELQ